MSRIWQLQEAKNKLSEVVEEAISNGPQVITRRGQEVAVVMSAAQFHQLTAKPEPLSAFFRASPFVGADLNLSRDKSAARPGLEL